MVPCTNRLVFFSTWSRDKVEGVPNIGAPPNHPNIPNLNSISLLKIRGLGYNPSFGKQPCQ
jgi:hypothetical protein